MDDDRDEKIRVRAHQIWENEGSPEGRENKHWLQAEEEIEAEAKAGQPPEKKPATV